MISCLDVSELGVAAWLNVTYGPLMLLHKLHLQLKIESDRKGFVTTVRYKDNNIIVATLLASSLA